MKFLGILRGSALCLLAIGFRGPRGILCSNLEVNPYAESPTVEVSDVSEKPMDSNVNTGDGSEGDLAAQVKMLQAKLQALEAGLDNASEESSTDDMAESMVESPLVEEAEDSTVESQDAVPEDRKKPHGPSDFSNDSDSEYEEKEPIKEAEKSSEEYEQHDVARKTETDVTSDPSTINLSDGSKNPDGSVATPSPNGAAEAMEAEHEELLKRISEDQEDSTVESSSQSCLVFENATWDDSQLASTIAFIKEFCEEVKGYKFSGNISEDKIKKLDEACSWVSFYLKSFRWRRVRGLHGNPYEDALKPDKFKDYAEWLKKHLPVIRTSMINMFNESKKLTEKQRETATSSGPYKYGFVCNDNWWKAVGSQFVIHQLVMAPSFLQSLKDLKSSLEDILNGPKGFTVESSSQPSVPVTKSNLVFENSEWDDSMLASTFLFLEEFCQEVKAEKFNEKLSDKKFTDLSKKCNDVSSYMGSFIHRFKPTYGPGSVAERKEIDMDFYKNVLKAEQFEVYAKWLVENIPGIEKSVMNMYYESKRLTEEQVHTETSVGPLKYGFVYNGEPQGELTHSSARGLFGSSTILQSLENLRSSLDDILGNSITKKILNFFSREKKSDVNSQQEDSTVKSQAV